MLILVKKAMNGEWNFSIPITIDQSGTQVKEIMETNEDGLGISKVTKTRFAEVYSLYGRNTDTVHIYVMEGMAGLEYIGDKAYLLPKKALFHLSFEFSRHIPRSTDRIYAKLLNPLKRPYS